MTAREVLEIATRGGAAVLGRDDIGSLEVGKCADFFSIDLNTVDYQRTEVVPPVPGFQDDCVVVFPFDTFAHLDASLRSDVRRALLERGAPLFAGEARQHTVAGARPAARPAGMVVTTRVKPGREPEFRVWEDSISPDSGGCPLGRLSEQ